MNIDPEHHHEIRKTGHNWLDMAVALSALLISLTSLIVAIVHSQTLERMADANAKLVETNSWPFLAYGTSNNNGVITLAVENDGVGPAKIESVELRWKKRPYANSVEFLKACCGFVPKSASLENDLMKGRVLRAGQTITFLVVPQTAMDQKTVGQLNVARLSSDLTVNVCYCSVFDECWTEDVVRFSLRPRQVDRCSQPDVPYEIPDK
jgi:hypothetical protein